MVRETRHLWVGNLPDNIREDRIREHFKRYGRVQNVKLLGRTESASAGASTGANLGAVSGVCATVAFMDIKSASKAHNAEHVLDERTLTTEYYEPAAIPTTAGAPSAGSSPAGSGYSGSSSSVNSAPAPASVSRYHLSGGEEGTGTTCAIAATAAAPANWRGTNDSATEYCRRGNTPATYGRYQRNNSNAPYTTPPSNVERTTPHHRWYASGERGATGGESTPSTPGGGTESGRRRRRSGSGSSRSDSSSPEPSDASRASTPAAGAAPPAPASASASASAAAPHHAAARTPPAHHLQWAATASGRPLAICVRNLPTRSTDSSLKDGLYHEYKKHGKVVWVKVVGQNADRYAVVRFKKPSDVEKALEVSQDKLFFGCKISVAPHQSCDEDADSAKPYETDIDEYHPKATRTLFIGNLEKDVTQQQLRDKFKHFGRIIEIDIKKGSGGGAGYAFCQYASISSVVEAIRAMDGEHVGGSRVKLGFGKPVATTCVWVDGLTEHTEKQVLGAVSRCGAATSVCVDRAAGAALVHFEQAAAAGAAVRELRRVAAHASAAEPERPRLAVDYASRECQEAFYEQLEKHGGTAPVTGSERLAGDLTPRYIPSTRHEPLRYDGCGSRSRASSYGRSSSRTPRYSSLEHYDPADYAADRRYRVYDELGSSPQTEETPYEDRLQSVVVSPHRARRHRRDSSPEDRKHSKERHRGVAIAGTRRSRSGSRGGERHAGRRRHRRRRDGSGSRGSRAGTPLRDEPDAPPTEPRRPPRERPPLPMSLPLPKFAAQLLRTAAPTPRPAPAPAPDSPPRPPSASSSSAGSAPHSPSLEERIRSLDEKYEKWSGSRLLPELPDRTRLRHRLLEVDINEVKPSEVVRSLLAKRSVFDEDSERLEGAVRAPSPGSSPRARAPPCVPRALRYPFPAHPAPQTPPTPPMPHQPQTLPVFLSTLPTTSHPISSTDIDLELCDRPADPRLNRPERPYQLERLGKFNESDYKLDSRIRLRTPSTDKSLDTNDRRQSPRSDRERHEHDRDPRRDNEKRRRDSLYSGSQSESKSSFEAEEKEVKEAIERIDPDFQSPERNCLVAVDRCQIEESLDSSDNKSLLQETTNKSEVTSESNTVSSSSTERSLEEPKENSIHDVADILLDHHIEKNREIVKLEEIEIQSAICDEKSKSGNVEHELPKQIEADISLSLSENKLDQPTLPHLNDSDKCKEILIQNQINKELMDLELHLGLSTANSLKQSKEMSEITQEFIKSHDKNGKERYNQNILEAFHNTKLEKENIELGKPLDKEKCVVEKRSQENDKNTEDRTKHDRDSRHCKERPEKDHERDKSKSNRNDKVSDKHEKEKKSKDDNNCEKSHSDKAENYIKIKIEKEIEKNHRDKNDKEVDKLKHMEEKSARQEHHRKDKRKDNGEMDSSKIKKEDKYKHERRKESDSKRDNKKDPDGVKSRKSSRDESSRDVCRKDSTDSSTSRASYDSSKLKDIEIKEEIKEEIKPKVKYYNDIFCKQEPDKELPKSVDTIKVEGTFKIKTEIKEEKESLDPCIKSKTDNNLEQSLKSKSEIFCDKQRHFSLDSPSVDCKRKERLNSSSSLPSHIGHKRRMSSQDSIDSLNEEIKKCRNESKCVERRDSKDSRSTDRHKTTKFNKGHFAKLIESKTKDDKKNQVKPPDDIFPDSRDVDLKDQKKSSKKSPKSDNEEKLNINSDIQAEGLQNDLDFLATLELRSSEEDERQKALRKEMKEKKRIQQLQQIQELQMQQDALQQAELMGKLKDEKKHKSDDKKKEAAREKRMSTDRKSRDDKNDGNKRKNRKQLQSTDSSDSDEPKKHSIFDIIDDEPTYISMYDKVKARSCKNMQKQEEEKRQEKIKAKFSQLKQSRAKREEKKRSSWDEDSDSDQERRKPQKVSMDSTSEDEQIVIHSKKREKSSYDYDRTKTNDYFSMPSTEEDSRNKLSRKNSRTRIISDTSDDDTSKRSFSKSPSFPNEIRKEFMSDFESLHRIKDDGIHFKEASDKTKKNSLLNLFGKSDSDDSKLKSSFESNHNKNSFMKTLSNDFSSESESMASNRNTCEIRKKHKKKQKKHKFTFSDDETKVVGNDVTVLDGDAKHKNLEKIRRHSNKKEKRKDKIRDSVDAEDSRDDKIKSRKDKKLPSNCFDSCMETSSSNIKKEGKMEDIFGPLSDESDRELGSQNNKLDISTHDHDSTFRLSNDQLNVTSNSEEIKLKEKDDNKRRKEKKRKEKRLFIKDDDNSLDVDAVSKAIEARLFAETITDEDDCPKVDLAHNCVTKSQESNFNYEDNKLIIENVKITDKHSEKLKRESKEKKKKKKKNKEDRQSRKDHHHLNHNEKYDNDLVELSPKSMLLDIPLPNDLQKVNTDETEKADNRNSLSESPSLPRLTDSPPIALRPCVNTDTKNKDSDTPGRHSGDHNMEVDYVEKKGIEVNDIPMPPPFENVVSDISEVPLPKDPIPNKLEQSKSEIFLTSFGRDVNVSEDAVRSISNLEKDTDKVIDKVDTQTCKVDKKLDEKPRAIISQEETEDAVAALLGESFGGKVDTFANCYEEVDNNTTHQIEIECSTIENENIPEEDAEEMRQAVQNLNASEMEMKPDTPVSDNDLLLIDTDTEEADETHQDAIDRLPVNIIATNQNLSVPPEQSKSEISNITKEKPPVQITRSETKEANMNIKEAEDIKLQLPKRDVVQQITSTATPVITSWTLTNNKLLEPRILNIQPNRLPNIEASDKKPTHITANIVQIKAPQNQAMNSSLRPIITPNRVSAPYQVINHMIRPQVPNMQPPTIKIPEPHIIYQKPPGIVISPRMSNDPRLQSPKVSPHTEGMTSPRLANMTILSTSQQNLNSVGIASPNAIQQRSPGQVTVVRMQQPPLSPIQAMHLPHGARTMVSPNRPNSVLVQTQGSPIHFNRLPVTPVLAPISKQMNVNNMIQQNKAMGVNNSLMHQQKIITGDCRKADPRNITENLNENSKIILSPTSLQHSTNPTVMAQNRLISMQNAIHAGNVNSLHLTNKVLVNNISHFNDKRDNMIQKSEQHNHIPYGSAPIIHVNHSAASIIQSSTKPVMCTLQEPSSRGQGTNVIHTLSSQRLLTTASISNVIQIDANKAPPSVLSMATIRSPTVLTKLESSNSVAITTNSLTNVVMTPLLLKTNASPGSIRLNNNKNDINHPESYSTTKAQNHLPHSDDKVDVKVDSAKLSPFDAMDKSKSTKPVASPIEHVAKCETDFEELLKNNTNEIKVTNDPEKKLEVNVGKTVTLLTANSQNRERKQSIEICKKEIEEDKSVTENSAGDSSHSDNKDVDQTSREIIKEISAKDSSADKTNIVKVVSEEVAKKEMDKDAERTSLLEDNLEKTCNSESQKSPHETSQNHEENKILTITSNHLDIDDTQMKNLEENDSWTAKDVNIESVIKKVESLCNENLDVDKKDDINGKVSNESAIGQISNAGESVQSAEPETSKPIDNQPQNERFTEISLSEESLTEKSTPISKRGGRNVRGKKSEKYQDRVQTRQIAKPSRGGTSAKRGRGRAKVDKKIKSLVNQTANNMPGDVYDFHEDSGDESATSPNKSESRPRLILTIKSPLSGQCNAIATSTLSITPKEQPRNPDKGNKDEKLEDFVSPSLNTRKSRRLQEKDVHRNTVDDVIEDVVKGSSPQIKNIKDATTNKKRQTRQTGAKVNQTDKTPGSDTRKSPRGVKRTRDRSLSDASVDSSDEKIAKREDIVKEAKVLKLSEPPVASKVDPDPPQPAKTTPPAPVNIQPVVPTPIMKPPKKMISEISAKLASAFEAAASAGPVRAQHPVDRIPLEVEKQPTPLRELRNPELATAAPSSDLMAAATGEARVSLSVGCGPETLSAHGGGTVGGEAALVRRLDAVGGGMAPVGATEASDARVQSPALPHRPPSAHRLADRATPLLIRGGDGEGASVAGVPSVANVAAGAGPAGGARGPRGYTGTASLPRGAHHPPQPPHARQVAIVGPHHHNPGAASRVTITSVPTISPQGQIALGEGMYPHFSHQHYQMYQQHFRATQHDTRATPSPYTRSLEAEGCEAPAPPLELRRPPSARVPRPAHSPSPADRLIMYAAGCGRSPPPAHGTSRLPGALPPTAAPGPPHASQVPREADSLQMLLRRYPVMWQGLLALKNDSAAVQMHFVGGNPGVAGDTLPRHTDGSTPPLRIAQRMRLEPAQLDQVHRKMMLENEHCILLALPCGRDHMDVLQQSTNLSAGFITYLQRKQAAGIVNVAPPGHHQAMYTVHIFPSCDFANENLNRIAPDLMHRVADIAHLLIVIATV